MLSGSISTTQVPFLLPQSNISSHLGSSCGAGRKDDVEYFVRYRPWDRFWDRHLRGAREVEVIHVEDGFLSRPGWKDLAKWKDALNHGHHVISHRIHVCYIYLHLPQKSTDLGNEKLATWGNHPRIGGKQLRSILILILIVILIELAVVCAPTRTSQRLRLCVKCDPPSISSWTPSCLFHRLTRTQHRPQQCQLYQLPQAGRRRAARPAGQRHISELQMQGTEKGDDGSEWGPEAGKAKLFANLEPFLFCFLTDVLWRPTKKKST